MHNGYRLLPWLHQEASDDSVTSIPAQMDPLPLSSPFQLQMTVQAPVQQLYGRGSNLEKGEVHALACYWVFGNLKRASLSQPSTLKWLRRGDRQAVRYRSSAAMQAIFFRASLL
jgi:hypothetical protein